MPSKSLSRRSIVAAVIVLVLVGGLGYFNYVFKPAMIKQVMSQMKPPPATITAEPAKTEKWGERLASIGTLVAIQGVDVASQVAGVITEIARESGEKVDLGGKLFQLDVAVEIADLASAKATLQEAEVAFQRQVELMQKRVTSEANLDTARAKRDTATAAMKRIDAIIAQKLIVAPFAGQLGIRKVNLGQYVSPGMALVSLQALDPIRVDFPMPEQQIGKLKVGQAIELRVDALPGKIFRGQIETLDARVAADTRTLLVRGTLANKDLVLLPGMFADITVLAGEPVDVVTVPRTAVTFTLYGNSVYVVKDAPAGQGAPAKAEPGKAAEPQRVVERRFVTTGQEREDRIAVTSGLAAGEVVVTTGQVKLNPGAAILIDNSQIPNRPEVRPKQ
jgi:membrane fusion protein (multidrug efflux system)